MQCEVCQTKEATVHVTELTEAGARERHLCQHCGQQQAAVPAKANAEASEGSEFKFETLQPPETKRRAVRVTHVPTGLSVSCDEDLPEVQLREISLQVLRARLREREK